MLHGWTTITIEWALVIFALIIVLLRIYVRLTTPRGSQNHNLSDAIVICAWLALVCMVSCDSALFKLGMMEWDSTYDAKMLSINSNPEDSRRMLKIIFVSVVPYTTILYLVKAAVIAWYYCITPSTFTRCRIALNIISVTCVVSFLVTMGFNGLSCYPVPRNWSLDADKLCVSSAQYSTFFISFGGHLCTDIAIFCYPFSLLKSIRRRLQHTRIRWGIIFLFLLGFLAIISTCARVIAVSLDCTAPTVTLATTTECTINILIACCPTLRALLQSQRAYPPPTTVGAKPCGSVDTYVSSSGQAVLHSTSGIWDGTESTAPEWIRLESRSIMRDLEKGHAPGAYGAHGCHGALGHTHGGSIISCDEKDCIISCSPSSPVASPIVGTPPGLILHPGRGIIKHAPGYVAPVQAAPPCWMSLPDVPFLCETKDTIEEEKDCGGSSMSSARQDRTVQVVRWEIQEQPQDGRVGTACSEGVGSGKTPLLKKLNR
ncbi:Similar to hypothetical protein AOL_s00080g416 [Arthrobotrys oligospora ATCC 24927]; acc. no. EGX48291 [Pyronema omphalodes CBS 100304]|uniref:Rhodopsin domain-containing protein n=1 Tax=Pyronema omphalodes (strain CBS 100304) TaxID=1076935 RepID=U4LI41_PYROM|nr:Similar to hypothetical protein AOL_s00080g416 [Arthrobotrys oligospora ATCC 24927]; acc. no. EGX48291 [Pyronema omphalodes CBS 100304]